MQGKEMGQKNVPKALEAGNRRCGRWGWQVGLLEKAC